MTAIVWFRRDLRLHDHPALRAALDAHDEVIPVFCLDDRLLHGRHASGPRTQFLLECLAELPLEILRGRPEEEIPKLAKQRGADEVHFTGDVSPFARRRKLRGVAHPGLTVVDDVGEITPYKVFSAFYRHWLQLPRREVIGKPRLSGESHVPELGDLGLEQEVSDPLPGGEAAARKRMNDWVKDGVEDYADNHDQLGADKTSRLSAYLPSAASRRGSWRASCRRKGGEPFAASWRGATSTTTSSTTSRPTPKSEFQDRYRGSIKWSYAKKAFEKWTQGQTGFPLVDAGMRGLLREGFMHNRARLVVGSFLTKDLGIDWRWGERWFMRLLIDGDEANNNGNWQWIASVGVDPSPRSGASTTRRATWSATTAAASTSAATCPSCARCRTGTWPSRGRCPPGCRRRPGV